MIAFPDTALQGGKEGNRRLGFAQEFGLGSCACVLIHLVFHGVGVPLGLLIRIVQAQELIPLVFLLPVQRIADKAFAIGQLKEPAGIHQHRNLHKRQPQAHFAAAEEGNRIGKLEGQIAGNQAEHLIGVDQRLLHHGLFDAQLGGNRQIRAPALQADGNHRVRRDALAPGAGKIHGRAAGEAALDHIVNQSAILVQGLILQRDGAADLLALLIHQHGEIMGRIVFGRIINGVLLRENVHAVKADHAQIGLAHIRGQAQGEPLAAPDAHPGHFLGAISFPEDYDAHRHPIVPIGPEILDQKGGQAVRAGFHGFVQVGMVIGGYLHAGVLERIAVFIPHDQAELLGGQHRHAEIQVLRLLFLRQPPGFLVQRVQRRAGGASLWGIH